MVNVMFWLSSPLISICSIQKSLRDGDSIFINLKHDLIDNLDLKITKIKSECFILSQKFSPVICIIVTVKTYLNLVACVGGSELDTCSFSTALGFGGNSS